MRKTFGTLIVDGFLLVIHASLVFASTGDLQVTSEPGVRIYVDGAFKGKTNQDDNGLFIEGVNPGRHTLKAVKTNYRPIVKDVNITENKTTEVLIRFDELQEKTKKLTPDIQESVALVGRLELRSVPIGAEVLLDGQKKGTADIEIENVKVGKHTVTFQKGSQKLSGSYSLSENETLKLKAHFKQHKIINLSEIERAENERRQKEEIARLEEKRYREELSRLEEEKKRNAQFESERNEYTIADPNTGLLWVRCTAMKCERSMIVNAQSYCGKLSLAGYNDWRLPSSGEISSFMDNLGVRDKDILLNKYRPGHDQTQPVSFCTDSMDDSHGISDTSYNYQMYKLFGAVSKINGMAGANPNFVCTIVCVR